VCTFLVNFMIASYKEATRTNVNGIWFIGV